MADRVERLEKDVNELLSLVRMLVEPERAQPDDEPPRQEPPKRRRKTSSSTHDDPAPTDRAATLRRRHHCSAGRWMPAVRRSRLRPLGLRRTSQMH